METFLAEQITGAQIYMKMYWSEAKFKGEKGSETNVWNDFHILEVQWLKEGLRELFDDADKFERFQSHFLLSFHARVCIPV